MSALSSITGEFSETQSVQGNSLKISGKKYDLSIGGYSVENSANKNSVSVSGTSQLGTVIGGKSDKSVANNNTVNISGPALVDVIIGGKAHTSAAFNSVSLSGFSSSKTAVGGYSESESASGNSVTVQENAQADNLFGGLSISGAATQNTVMLLGSQAIVNAIGGYSEKGRARFNKINVEGTSGFKRVIGGVSKSGSTDNNEVIISSEVSGDIVAGGISFSDVAWSNSIEIKAARAIEQAIGAHSEEQDVYWNSVAVSGNSSVATVIGGSSAKGNSTENTVSLSGNAHSVKVIGGQSQAGVASDNSVSVSGNATAQSVTGGFSSKDNANWNSVSIAANNGVNKAVAGSSIEANVSHNRVEVTNGSAVGTVVGGKSSQGSAYSNSVHISEGSSLNSAFGGVSDSDAQVFSNNVSVSNSVIKQHAAAGQSQGNVRQNKITLSRSKANEIYGGWSQNGDVTNNVVQISLESEVTQAYGGYSAFGAAGTGVKTGNSLVINSSKIILAYGGLSNVGSAEGNQAVLKNDSLARNIYGGYIAQSGNVKENTLKISDSTVNETAAGGFTKSGLSESNRLTIEQGQVQTAVGGAALLGEANGNSLLIEASSHVSNAVGGVISTGSIVSNNFVRVSESVVTGAAIGGLVRLESETYHADPLVTSNVLEIRNSEVGYGLGAAAKQGSLVSNLVKISESQISGSVFGVYAESGHKQQDNIVSIEGNTFIQGSVYGAFSEEGRIPLVSSNSVVLNGDIKVLGTVYGAYLGNNPVNLGGNTLVFGGRVEAGDINGYSDLHFLVSPENKLTDNTEFILTLTGTNKTEIVGKEIHLYDQGSLLESETGSKYGLIRIKQVERGSDLPRNAIHIDSDIKLYGTFNDTTWELVNQDVGQLYISGKELIVEPPQPDDSDSDTGNGDGADNVSTPDNSVKPDTPNDVVIIQGQTKSSENARSVSENRLASLVFVHQNAMFAAQATLNAMREQANGKFTFGVSEGGTNRYGKSGRHFDLNSMTFVAGAGAKIGSGALSGFVEGSWGHAAGDRSGYSAKSNLSSFGVGVLYSFDFSDFFSLDGSVSAGQVRNRFKGNYYNVGTNADFTTRSPYVSAHIGANLRHPLSESFELGAHVRYFFTFLSKDNVLTGGTTQDRYKASASGAHTLSIGTYAFWMPKDTIRASLGLGILETMGARPKGSIDGISLEQSTANGTSGTASFSLSAKPSKTSPWEFSFGVNGYLGSRQGVSGSARVTYSF